MTLCEKIKSLLSQIKEIEANPTDDKKLPQNSYYLNESDFLCCERSFEKADIPMMQTVL